MNVAASGSERVVYRRLMRRLGGRVTLWLWLIVRHMLDIRIDRIDDARSFDKIFVSHKLFPI